MPEQVLPTSEEFQSFCRKLLEEGFYEKSARELCDRYSRLRLVAPRPIEGRQLALVYFDNGLTVVVWTTWTSEKQRFRKRSSGWVIILDEKGDIVYSSRPKCRTKDFLHRLFMYADIARSRVFKRPPCPECKSLMKIVHGRGMKSTYWRCRRRLDHRCERARSLSFDIGLTAEQIAFLKKERKIRARYLKSVRKAGKEPFVAMRKRKRWAVEMI